MTKTDHRLEPLFNVLRGDHADPVTGEPATDPDLLSLQRRLRRALERDQAGAPVADGYPTSSLGGGGSGAGGVSRPTENALLGHYQVDPLDPDGPGYWVPARDEVRDLTRSALRAIEDAASNLALARKKLDQLDVLTGITGAASLDTEPCESCARADGPDGKPLYSPMYRFTTLDRLSRKWRLCQWCYDHVRNKGHLPEVERIVAYHDGRRQRQKAS